MEWMKTAWTWIAVAGVLFFLDAPLLTWRQKFVAERSRQRLILVMFELDLVILWAIARFYFGWDRALAPAGATALGALGLAMTAAGVTLSVWGKLRLGRWFSATFGVKQGHELVTDGPYRITRHPIYTGTLAAIFGASWVWNSLATFILAILLGALVFLHTVYEESLFERHFGDAYRGYLAEVPRLVPFLRMGRS